MAIRFGGFTFGEPNAELMRKTSLGAVSAIADSLPPDQRGDVYKNYAKMISGLSTGSVDDLFGYIQNLAPERMEALRKSQAEARDPYTKVLPALQMFGMYNGIKERQGYNNVTFEVLRRMAKRCPPVASIIQTRCNQVAAFAKTPNSRTDGGFKIAMRDRKANSSPAVDEKIEALQRAVMRCGVTEPAFEDGEHTFNHFLRMITRDSLTLDAMCFEVRPGRDAKKWPVSRWQAVDAALVRKVEPDLYRDKGIGEGLRDVPASYVQWCNGKVESEFTYWEMAYGIRNPSSDITTLGYGVSELELLIDIVTSTLHSINYNKTYFTQNSVPAGILSVSGNVSDTMMDAFKVQWEAQIKGPDNYWKTPIIASRDGQGVQYIPFKQQGSNDMSFHLWMQFLITITCAIFCCHPEEVGIPAWNPSKGSIGAESSPVSRIKHSEDKGLVPLFTSIADTLNEMIIYRIDPDFEFQWTNTSEFDTMADIQFRATRVSSFTTVNEERAEMDLSPLEGEEYDRVLNPLTFTAPQQREQMDMQKEQMAMMGQQGQEPGPEQGAEDIQSDMEGPGNGQEFVPNQGKQDGGAGNAKAAMMARANAGNASGNTSTGKRNPVVAKSLSTSIHTLNLSKGLTRKLTENGIDFLGDLKEISALDLMTDYNPTEHAEIAQTIGGLS